MTQPVTHAVEIDLDALSAEEVEHSSARSAAYHWLANPRSDATGAPLRGQYLTHHARISPFRGKALKLVATLKAHAALAQALHGFAGHLFDGQLYSPSLASYPPASERGNLWPVDLLPADAASWLPGYLPSAWGEAAPVFQRFLDESPAVTAFPELAEAAKAMGLRLAKDTWRLWRYFPEACRVTVRGVKHTPYRCTLPHGAFDLQLATGGQRPDGRRSSTSILRVLGMNLPLFFDQNTRSLLASGKLELREVSLVLERLSVEGERAMIAKYRKATDGRIGMSIIDATDLNRGYSNTDANGDPVRYCVGVQLCLRRTGGDQGPTAPRRGASRADAPHDRTTPTSADAAQAPATVVEYTDPTLRHPHLQGASPEALQAAVEADAEVRSTWRERAARKFSWDFLVSGCSVANMLRRDLLLTTPTELQTVAPAHRFLVPRLTRA